MPSDQERREYAHAAAGLPPPKWPPRADAKRPLRIPRYLKDAENELARVRLCYEEGCWDYGLKALAELDRVSGILKQLLGDTDA